MTPREAVKAAALETTPRYVLTDGTDFIVPSTALDDQRVWVLADGTVERRSVWNEADTQRADAMNSVDLEGRPYEMPTFQREFFTPDQDRPPGEMSR